MKDMCLFLYFNASDVTEEKIFLFVFIGNLSGDSPCDWGYTCPGMRGCVRVPTDSHFF